MAACLRKDALKRRDERKSKVFAMQCGGALDSMCMSAIGETS